MNFTFHDINEAYYELQTQRRHFSELEDTRNGEAFVFRDPVLVTHTMPWRRVLFDPVRDANPFFHYMEAIWILSGSNSVEFPAYFAKNIRNYSDDGQTIHGAYGHRWRRNFLMDQLEEVIDMLKKDPNTRRAVLSMWDPDKDLAVASKDLPCNTHIYFRTGYGKLDMTVCNRSNDLVWGMLGANAVHFSILQEYIANAAGLELGRFHQFTNNLHVYKGFEDKFGPPQRWYSGRAMFTSVRFSPNTLGLSEAEYFVEDPEDDPTKHDYESSIITQNASPMLQAYQAYRNGELNLAVHLARRIYDADWQAACVDWLERRRIHAEQSEG